MQLGNAPFFVCVPGDGTMFRQNLLPGGGAADSFFMLKRYKKITRSEKTGIMAVGSEVIWIDFPFAGGILRNGAVAVAFDFSASGSCKKKQRRHNQGDGAN